jgi:hypothetical protein
MPTLIGDFPKGANMLRRSRIAAAGVIAAALGLASSATATTPPSGNGHIVLPAMCGPIGGPFTTQTLIIAGPSTASFWVGSQHYVLTQITFTNPTSPIPQTKYYGNRNGRTPSIECISAVPGMTFDGIGASST